MFRSVICFGLVFDYDVKCRSKVLLLACGYPVVAA